MAAGRGGSGSHAAVLASGDCVSMQRVPTHRPHTFPTLRWLGLPVMVPGAACRQSFASDQVLGVQEEVQLREQVGPGPWPLRRARGLRFGSASAGGGHLSGPHAGSMRQLSADTARLHACFPDPTVVVLDIPPPSRPRNHTQNTHPGLRQHPECRGHSALQGGAPEVWQVLLPVPQWWAPSLPSAGGRPLAAAALPFQPAVPWLLVE